MANSTAAAATNNDNAAEDPNKKKGQTADAAESPKEGEEHEEKEQGAIEKAACNIWQDVSSLVSWGVKKGGELAGDAASLVVPNLWCEAPKKPAEATAATASAGTPEAVQQTDKPKVEAEKPEERGFFGRAWDVVKSGVDAVTGAVTDAWRGIWGKDATITEDKTSDGQKKGFTVTEKDGDVITATRDGTQIKKGDGTIITREGGVTTVEKNEISISRDRSGRETFKLKDGTTGTIDANKEMSVELKALHETISDKGVRGEIRSAEIGRITYFNAGRRPMHSLSRQEKDNDIVQAGDATRVAMDRPNGIFVERSTNPQEKTAIFKKDGSNEGVEVKQENGRVVARLVKLDADGKPIAGSGQEAAVSTDLPAWFKEYAAKRNGRQPANVAEALNAAGVKSEGGDISVTAANRLRLGPCQKDGKVQVDVPMGPNPEQKVVLTNGGGTQKVDDLVNKQSTEWNGTEYSQKNDGVEQIRYNPNERHLELFDERGNRIVDSTSSGTRFSDGDYIGADGSYTDGSTGRKYYSQNAQEMQNASNQSIVALNTAAGQINSFKAALGRPGAVDVGELSSSMGSLTQALALCIKSGNFSHLASILSAMGSCQDLMAQGIKHNADVSIVKAAVHDAKDSELAANERAPNDVAVEALRRNRMTA